MTFFTRFPIRKDGRAGRDADGDGILNEGKDGYGKSVEKQLGSSALDLRSHFRGSKNRFLVNEDFEDTGDHSFSIRDWGKWTSRPDTDEPEDDDHQTLTPESRKNLEAIVSKIETRYPDVVVSFSEHEKNWLAVKVSPRPRRSSSPARLT